MKKLTMVSALLIAFVAQGVYAVEAILKDRDGKFISLYGFADYTKVKNELQSQNGKPVPFDAKGQPTDEAHAVYAMLGLTLYNANYAFVQPGDVAKPKVMPQFFISYLIVNPASYLPEYGNQAQYHPELPTLMHGILYTSDSVLRREGQNIWGTPWKLGKAGRFEINFKETNLQATTASGTFSDIHDQQLIELQMAKLSDPKNPVVRIFRSYDLNSIATSDLASNLYLIKSHDDLIQRFFDPQVDTYKPSGEIESYVNRIGGFYPKIWQTSLHWNSDVFTSYIPKPDGK